MKSTLALKRAITICSSPPPPSTPNTHTQAVKHPKKTILIMIHFLQSRCYPVMRIKFFFSFFFNLSKGIRMDRNMYVTYWEKNLINQPKKSKSNTGEENRQHPLDAMKNSTDPCVSDNTWKRSPGSWKTKRSWSNISPSPPPQLTS